MTRYVFVQGKVEEYDPASHSGFVPYVKLSDVQEHAVEQALTVLNEALAADPAAISTLMGIRVSCNETLAAHPTIQVGPDPAIGAHGSVNKVGVMGLLNGIFGMNAAGAGVICMAIEEGRVVDFRRTPA